MGAAGVQMVCVVLGMLGLVAGIICCAVPKWKESSFTGQNIVTAQVTQDGLWMSCVVQSTGQQQCKTYDSLLILSADLQAARAMTIISCLLAALSVLILFAGADFTTCVQNEEAKPKIALVAGVGLILAGFLLIIPVSWSAHNVIREFQNPLNPQKMELGACIFVGWAGSVVLLLAGGLLCCFSRIRSGGGSAGNAKYYSNGASAPAPAAKNYV
ncbi:claudin-4-like [Anguilla anguilla]|uniref:claudin-4-like n=1 Tax=Anguilla anguilla TaxID=7936 RepID=UPI0015AA3B04|nr:claudin-4-like [Anguilla anguilla]XP_035254760.1 claudin-4-like [Anguilla anguilla]